MEAAIRFSQNSLPGQEDQHFLKIDIAGRSLQLYNITEFRKNSIRYELIHSYKKLSPFRAFDWHPDTTTLVAIGQSGGEAGLVDLAYPDEKPTSFNARNPRSCNAVALNTTDWIAIGLDKARTDHGLYLWDINHHVSHSGNKNYKNINTPIHKIASGECVTSLRFFQDHPQLLAAGVPGFVRLYDLRDSNPSSVVQFATKCVNNIAVDMQDENYFASCLQTNTPTVAVWDRRMITRTDAPTHFGFGTPVSQCDQQPEVSAELANVAESDSHVFGLRFSKTHRGHLGVLLNTGGLKVINFHKVDSTSYQSQDQRKPSAFNWNKQRPQDIYVDNVQNVSSQPTGLRSGSDDPKLLSFDFTTATSRHGQPTIVTLNKRGEISFRPASGSNNYVLPSPAITMERYNMLNKSESIESEKSSDVGTVVKDGSHRSDKAIEAFESLKVPRQRCLDGYLLDATENCMIVHEDDKVLALWKWLEHAKAISANNALVEGEIDLSYAGICDLWLEELDAHARVVRSSFTIETPQLSSIIRDTARRLGLIRGKGCSTDYLQHRALCLHALGLPWLRSDVQRECDRLLANKELTKAAAIALFAGEEKIAQKALRAEGSGNSHKMLAMALVSSRNRVHNARKHSHGSSPSGEEDSDSSDDSQNDEWQDIIAAISADLTDCYAKSILALVKTNSWEDVVSQNCLPLIYRVHVALRHSNDTNLTNLLPKLRNQAISSGDLEGIVLTGLGSPASITLLTRYTKLTGDLQTSALAMSYDAVFDRFLSPDSPSFRAIHCYREAYKSQLMSYTLKFDKTRFTIAVSRALRSHNLTSQPRKKEQIRLICSHCNQSIAQFGHDQQIDEHKPSMTLLNANTPSTVETAKHPLGPHKAAVTGTICPRCSRHLPRCGVCDLWLGMPNETFSKWYSNSLAPATQHPAPGLASHRNSNTTTKAAERDPDGTPSMIGSTVTAIGPTSTGTGTPLLKLPAGAGAGGGPPRSGSGSGSGSRTLAAKSLAIPNKLTTADLVSNAVAIEIVDDESVVKQAREKKWWDAMHRFTVFCTRCSHGFHAEHARMWFDGEGEGGEEGNGEGHRVCPVAGCECLCNS